MVIPEFRAWLFVPPTVTEYYSCRIVAPSLGSCAGFWRNLQATQAGLLCGSEYVIVPVRLFIFKKNISLYGLIGDCTFINFERIIFLCSYFPKIGTNFIQNSNPVRLFSPVLLFIFWENRSCIVIRDCTIIRNYRVSSEFARFRTWLEPSI